MSDWVSLTLGEIALSMGDGGTPSRENPNNFGGDVPWVVISDISKYISTTKETLSQIGLNSCTAKVWDVDSIILSTGATIGLVGIAKVPLATKQGITGIKPKKIVDNEFFYYALCFKKPNIIAWSQGSTFAEIRVPILSKVPVSIPKDVTEQKKIATILSTIDTAIEKTEALIAKYQQIKAGLMHDLFTRGVLPNGQLRPSREQAPELYQESAIGWIPKDWKSLNLKEALAASGGYLQTGPFGSQLHAHEYQDEGIPVIMPQDINDGLIDTYEIARITEARASTLAKHRVQPGDIIIARRGELSRAAAITEQETSWLCGTGCFLLRLKRSELNHYFVASAYRHDIVQRQIAGLAVGSTMPSLNNEVMNKLVFPFPDPEEQHRIVLRIDTSDQKIRGLFQQVMKLKNQKLGLMQDLLTGKVPVSVKKPEAAHG